MKSRVVDQFIQSKKLSYFSSVSRMYTHGASDYMAVLFYFKSHTFCGKLPSRVCRGANLSY